MSTIAVMENPNEELKKSLIKVAKPHLKFLEPGQKVDMGIDLADAGLDSMSSINLLLDIEEEMGIPIPDEMIEEESFETLSSVFRLVKKAKAAADAA